MLDTGAASSSSCPRGEVPGRPPRHGAQHLRHTLLERAGDVQQLAFTESTSQAHMAASRHMLHLADQLFAAWDGQPARAWGDTAGVVDEARELGPVRSSGRTAPTR